MVVNVNTESGKVFEPPWMSSPRVWVIYLALQYWFLDAVFKHGDAYVRDNIISLLVMEMFALLLLLFALSTTTERVLITSGAVTRTNIFGKKTVPLNSIRLARKKSIGRGQLVLEIVTDHTTMSVGNSWSESVIDEAAKYISEQIERYYPERSDLLKDEQSYEVERFWRK